MKRIDVVIAVVVRDGKVLVCQRRDDDTFGGYWEFPGGKLEPHESHEQCLARELREELAIRIRPLDPLEPIEHDYPHARIRLHAMTFRQPRYFYQQLFLTKRNLKIVVCAGGKTFQQSYLFFAHGAYEQNWNTRSLG